MKLKFVVEVSSNKQDPDKLDVEIKRPTRVSKKWGSLALLIHMGIFKGLQDSFKVMNGELADGKKSNGSKK